MKTPCWLLVSLLLASALRLSAQNYFFTGTQSAGSGTYNHPSGAGFDFSDQSTAGSATFTGSIYFLFWESSNAGSASITTTLAMEFNGNSSAGSATITNRGSVIFAENSSAGSATITNHSGGGLAFSDTSTADNATIENHGSLSIYGAGLRIGSFSGSGNLDLSNGLIIGGLNTSTTYSGAIIDYGAGAGLTKIGTGAFTLSGANDYYGATVVSAGSLIVANTTGSGTGYGTVTVNSGATLGGTGFIGGLATLESGATLAPGNSPGTLTFADGLTLASGSILNFELGTVSDLLRITGGTLTGPSSAGGVTLNLANSGGFSAATYTLFDFSGATTTSFDVSDFTFGNTISGYTYSLALSGSTLQLTAVASAIPEPSTYAALAGLAALGLVIYRRRNERSAFSGQLSA